MIEGCVQQCPVTDIIFLKSIQEWSRSVLYLALPNDYNILEVLVYPARLQVSPNCYIGIISRAEFRIINHLESLIEQIIEDFMNIVSLTHHHSVTHYS